MNHNIFEENIHPVIENFINNTVSTNMISFLELIKTFLNCQDSILYIETIRKEQDEQIYTRIKELYNSLYSDNLFNLFVRRKI